MAIPSRVIAIDGDMATVECFGVERFVSLMLMNDTVSLGDYLAIQAGAFAVEKVAPDMAEEALRYFSEALDGADTSDEPR